MRWVITGANRGIGLEFVVQLSARGDEVEALARAPDRARELQAVAVHSDGRVRLHACDVTDDANVREVAGRISGAVDVVLNNAGVGGKWQSLEELELEDVLHAFRVNAVGALSVTRAFLPHLRAGRTRKIVNMSSGMGSIGDNSSGGNYAYRMSKAALNMAARTMAVDLSGEGFICGAISPGWLKTDMGGEGAPTPVDEGVRRLLARIDALRPEESGQFWDYKGGQFPW